MKLSLALFVASVLATMPVIVRGDTFVLAQGGQIDGTLVNASENPRTKYVIRLGGNGEVTLARDQVKEVRRVKPAELDYVKLRPQYPDTVEGQWSLAEWCRERQLSEHRKRHMERVIELEPEHLKARQGLGYAKVDGVWKTRDEVFLDRGMVKDETGKYRVPQQIEELKRKRADEKSQKEWFKKIERWRDWLNGARAEEAQAQFLKIHEPEAVLALHKKLQREPIDDVRKLYVDALARIANSDAWQALIVCSLDDPTEELRLVCLDHLEKVPQSGAVPIYIKRLRAKDNTIVNRAGVGLGRMKDPTAVRPLIDALMTTHLFEVAPGAGGGNAMNPTFGNGPGGGGGSFNFGGGGPKVESRTLQNPGVHDALVSLTGVNFEYDQASWRRWLASQKKADTIDARRD